MSRPGPFARTISRLKEILTYEEKTAYRDQNAGFDTAAEDHWIFAEELRHALVVLKAAGKEKIVWDKKTGLLKFTNGYPDELICAIHEAQEASREK